LRDPAVDLRVPGRATPRPGDPKGTESRLQTVPEFARRVGATLAINANFYARLPGAPMGWMAGQPVDLLGPSVSEGRVVSPAKRSGLGHPALLVTRDRQARIKCALARDLAGQDDVVAGVNHPPTRGCLLLENGRNHGDKASASLRARHPRTAAGLTRDRRELILVVVDGRQPGWSVGMTLPELGALMRRLGAHTAVNLDGGGSSSFLYRPARGAEVSNRPSDGGWRPVANQLAVVLRTP
ncbi:MAG TPA: phosphodiester glycosidase family protein, partial [Longimicrobiales bacterium]|nr:phosphodiester glycosidase family protein [Longimicrobiales bacterium]